MISRRSLVKFGGLTFFAAGYKPIVTHADRTQVDILIRSNKSGSKVWFDPAGILIRRNTTVRWVLKESVHTVTAYHPDNDNHSLRIPMDAKSWDSGYLVNPGDQFEVHLSVPGVYDYYCIPHEQGGMAGRIIVDEPTGPGAKPFDYFKSMQPAPDWKSVPDQARLSIPSISTIMSMEPQG